MIWVSKFQSCASRCLTTCELDPEEKDTLEKIEDLIVGCEVAAQTLHERSSELRSIGVLPDNVSLECEAKLKDLTESVGGLYELLESFWESVDPQKVPYMPQEPPFFHRSDFPFIYYSGPVVFPN